MVQVISSDFIIHEGKVIYLCSTKSNKIHENNSFTITQSVYPSITSKEESTLVIIAQKIVDAFELPDGPLLIQSILHNNEFSVVEFSERIGGGSKYDLIEQLTDFNIMEYYVNLNLGILTEIRISKKYEYALMNYVYAKNGVIKEIKGLETLKQSSIIDKYYIYKKNDSVITKHDTSSDRPFGFLLLSNSKDDINKRLEICDNALAILDDSGVDIMMHSINKGFV